MEPSLHIEISQPASWGIALERIGCKCEALGCDACLNIFPQTHSKTLIHFWIVLKQGQKGIARYLSYAAAVDGSHGNGLAIPQQVKTTCEIVPALAIGNNTF